MSMSMTSPDPRNPSDGWRKPVPGYVGHKPYFWSQNEFSYTGPHDAPEPKVYAPHISSYSGHQPMWRARSSSAPGGGKSEGLDGTIKISTAKDPQFIRRFHAMPKYAGHIPVELKR